MGARCPKLAPRCVGAAPNDRDVKGRPILGKTGPCSRDGTRDGLFASYPGIEHPKLVVLRGNRAVFAPRAAQVAGVIYRSLDQQHYFEAAAVRRRAALPAMSLLVH